MSVRFMESFDNEHEGKLKGRQAYRKEHVSGHLMRGGGASFPPTCQDGEPRVFILGIVLNVGKGKNLVIHGKGINGW